MKRNLIEIYGTEVLSLAGFEWYADTIWHNPTQEYNHVFFQKVQSIETFRTNTGIVLACLTTTKEKTNVYAS